MVVLASNNKHKLKEFREILSGSGFSDSRFSSQNIISLADVDFFQSIPETGNTFAENALQKARTVSEATGMPAIADDSGLEVFVLDGRPGIFSARFAGENAADEENNLLLLEKLKGVPAEKRDARFVANVALVWPGRGIFQAEGECSGRILEEPRGENGFGYDSLFWVPEFGKTTAEMSYEEKNKISHRYKALEKLRTILS